MSSNNVPPRLVLHVSARHQPNPSLHWFSSFVADEQFRWADFSPVQFEKWATGEPNGNASDSGCVRMYTSNGIEDGIWDDYFCDYHNQFVCKTPKGTQWPCKIFIHATESIICTTAVQWGIWFGFFPKDQFLKKFIGFYKLCQVSSWLSPQSPVLSPLICEILKLTHANSGLPGTTPTQGPGTCPDNWVPLGNYCYHFRPDDFSTWTMAQDECSSKIFSTVLFSSSPV